ncbi:MAG: GNAT family N-acetyltransferase [Bacteroidota bacterium]
MDKPLTIEIITPENYKEASVTAEQIAGFLHSHLDRFRDPKDQIMQCLDCALGKIECRRGFILFTTEEDSGDILGAVVVLETGMSGYVPDNLLVYIAVDSKTRGRGIGLALMEKAIETARGDLALHVEPDNPARRLYERIGFTSKYLEMRYKK